MITVLELGDVSVDVVFKDIKNVHLSVYPPRAASGFRRRSVLSLDTIRMYAISKLGWIKRQQTKLLSQAREQPREYLERESHYLWGDRYLLEIAEGEKPSRAIPAHRKIVLNVPQGASAEKRQQIFEDWYRAELKAAMEPLIEKWEKRLDVCVERAFVQKMKTKWGSSNPQSRNIRLNLELAKKPPQCLDYVTLHEILHFLAPDHGEKFVALMDHHYPQWRSVRQTLNEAPLANTDWTCSAASPALTFRHGDFRTAAHCQSP